MLASERFSGSSEKSHDPVGFLADQTGQVAVGIGRQRGFEQLRGPADTGERVFDLMRQKRRKAGHRARRIAMDELTVDPPRDRLLVQRQDRHRRAVGQRRRGNRQISRGVARILNRHVVFCDARLPVHRLEHQRKDRAVARQDVPQPAADQNVGALLEKLLRRRIDETDGAVFFERDHRKGHGRQNLQWMNVFRQNGIQTGHQAAFPRALPRLKATALPPLKKKFSTSFNRSETFQILLILFLNSADP